MSEFNIDSLLDGTLDDLADLPEFRPFPIGTYNAQFKLEADKKDKTIIYAKLKVNETLELADPNETPVENGAEAQVRYDLKNEYGQGAFKKLLVSLSNHFGVKSNRDLLADVAEFIEVVVTTKQNVNKKNGAVYTDIVELQVL